MQRTTLACGYSAQAAWPGSMAPAWGTCAPQEVCSWAPVCMHGSPFCTCAACCRHCRPAVVPGRACCHVVVCHMSTLRRGLSRGLPVQPVQACPRKHPHRAGVRRHPHRVPSCHLVAVVSGGRQAHHPRHAPCVLGPCVLALPSHLTASFERQCCGIWHVSASCDGAAQAGMHDPVWTACRCAGSAGVRWPEAVSPGRGRPQGGVAQPAGGCRHRAHHI